MFTLASEQPAIDLDREIDPVEAASAVAQLHARIVESLGDLRRFSPDLNSAPASHSLTLF